MTAKEVLSGNEQSTYFYHANEHGDINYITSQSGEVKNRYDYDAFGRFKKADEIVRNRFGYAGECYDSITEQYYLRARYYNPLVGRFMSEDAYRGDGLNLYAYCGNNPVAYVDPSGYKKSGKCGTGSEDSRTKWGAEHGKGNVKHNNAIENELDEAYENGATDIRKNRVQRDANGNRVYDSDGRYTKPDASYVKDGERYNTNYVSNYELNNLDELNREIEAFNRMCNADSEAHNSLVFKY